MLKIAIVGTGLIGRAWTMVFANAGFDVAIYDPKAGAARAARTFVGRNLREFEALKLAKHPKAALARIRIANNLEDALEGCALVQENGPEILEEKKKLFAELDRLAPKDAILASSTSFIVASRFAKRLKGRARCLVAHPVNPPHLAPIVELCPSPWTDPAVVSRAREIYERAGQVPVVLNREIPGFVLNRLQAVLLSEAFRIVGEGICSPQDLDKTIKDGLGLRWSFMGPFETIELNAPGGIPDYCARYGASLHEMAKGSGGANPFGQETVATVMRQWVGEQNPDRIAKLSAWRDKRLAALKAFKKKTARKPA